MNIFKSFCPFLISFLLLIMPELLSAQILIFTYAYNRPDFIEIQHKTLQKFLQDDYEFIIFNDARPQYMINEIQSTCNQLGLKCIRIPQEIHDRPYLERLPPGENYNHPTVRNVNVVMYSLNTLGFDHNDIVMLLDSDMFLIKPFSVRTFLDGYHLGGRHLSRNSRTDTGDILYLWHGLAFLDMRIMPNRHTLNFNSGRIEGKPVDGGAYSYYYFKNNPNIKAHFIDYAFSSDFQCYECQKSNSILCTHNTDILKKEKLDEHQIRLFQSVPTSGPYYTSSLELFCNNSFLHYRCGTNWDGKNAEYHQQKTTAVNKYLDSILN